MPCRELIRRRRVHRRPGANREAAQGHESATARGAREAIGVGKEYDATATGGPQSFPGSPMSDPGVGGEGGNRLEFAAVSVKSIHHDNQA
jgi:hypothetical protein